MSSNSKSKSKLRNNLDSIKSDVDNLLKDIDTPDDKMFQHPANTFSSNDKIFQRSMNTEIVANGYNDPSNLYRTNMNSTGVNSLRVQRDMQAFDEQNRNMNNPQGDNRNFLYPNSEVNNPGNLRDAYIQNGNGTPFKNASIRGSTPPYDVLMSTSDKNRLREQSRDRTTERRINNEDRERNLNKQQSERANYYPNNEIRDYDVGKDQRSVLYPNSTVNEYGNERDKMILDNNRNNNFPISGDSGAVPSIQRAPLNPRMVSGDPSVAASFQNSSQRNSFNPRQPTGDVFAHNNQRDRIPINPKENYRGSDFQSTPYNQLDTEVNYDKRKDLVNNGETNYPSGTVFSHNAQRDRVPIDPLNVYRSSDYQSTPYNQLDIDVDHVPQVARVNATSAYILNREFEVVNDNRTSQGEKDEVTMIHPPYTPLDKFNKSDVVFKNINETKPQVDVLNEYIVNIDSADRNITFFPNPFKMRVLFNAGNDVGINGSPDLKILKDFENIKYLRLETATFPRYYSLLLTSCTGATSNVGDLTEQDIVHTIISHIDGTHGDTSANFLTFILALVIPTNYVVNYVAYVPYVLTVTIYVTYTSPDTNKSEVISYVYKYSGTNDDTFKITRNGNDLADASNVFYTNEKKIINDIKSEIITHTSEANFTTFITDYNNNSLPEYYSLLTKASYNNPTYINAKFTIINSNVIPSVSIAYELVYNGSIGDTITNRYIVDTTKDLSTDRYTMLNIDEITDNTQSSTSGKNQYNYLYPDYITTNYFYGDNHFVDKIYKNTKLGMIKNLTMQLSDSFGNLIKGGKYIDTTITTGKSCTCEDTPNIYNCSCNYIRHPYYRNFQLTLMFKVGCYESEIDKKIFY